MAFAVLDLVKGVFESQLLGSTVVLVLILVAIVALMLAFARVPPQFIILILAPLALGLQAAGIVNAVFLWSGFVVIIGLMAGMAFMKLFR